MACVIPGDRSKDAWIAAAWKQKREVFGPTRVHRNVSDSGEDFKGKDLSRKHWSKLMWTRTASSGFSCCRGNADIS